MSTFKNISYGLGIFVVAFGVMEIILYLAGVNTAYKNDDPYVGFSASSPLFVKRDTLGSSHMVTAHNKSKLFNRQAFPVKKSSDTYRIFTLGGSTTYGRPYNDKTSFTRWLREFLPHQDESKNWEVINAGGISYASYRVARLMEELVNYQPDLFIIYSGHNEFLEERTYRKLKEIPPAILALTTLLEKTRSYSGLKVLYQGLSGKKKKSRGRDQKFKMKGEVETLLDNSFGPQNFHRDDSLKKNILAHYRLTVKRISALALEAGADILFINTPSNLKNFSPFKSEFKAGLTSGKKAALRAEMAVAESLTLSGDYSGALVHYDKVLEEDSRYPEALYRKGKLFLNLKNNNGAARFLRMAKDEDVCPLRALDETGKILSDVSREKNLPLLDWQGVLTRKNKELLGHEILGEEFFLDHVHLTVEAHRLLAEEIMDVMIEKGWAAINSDFTTPRKEALVEKVMADVDNMSMGVGLHFIAKVFNWAGKHEDAENMAEKALKLDSTHLEAFGSSLIVGAKYHRQGDLDKALPHYKRAHVIDSNNTEVNRFMGLIYEEKKNWKAALRHFLLYMDYDQNDIVVHQSMAHIYRELGEYPPAARHYSYLTRRNPKNSFYRYNLGYCRFKMGQYTKAEKEWRTVLQINPGHSKALQGLKKMGSKMEAPGTPDVFTKKRSPAENRALERLKQKLKERKN